MILERLGTIVAKQNKTDKSLFFGLKTEDKQSPYLTMFMKRYADEPNALQLLLPIYTNKELTEVKALLDSGQDKVDTQLAFMLHTVTMKGVFVFPIKTAKTLAMVYYALLEAREYRTFALTTIYEFSLVNGVSLKKSGFLGIANAEKETKKFIPEHGQEVTTVTADRDINPVILPEEDIKTKRVEMEGSDKAITKKISVMVKRTDDQLATLQKNKYFANKPDVLDAECLKWTGKKYLELKEIGTKGTTNKKEYLSLYTKLYEGLRKYWISRIVEEAIPTPKLVIDKLLFDKSGELFKEGMEDVLNKWMEDNSIPDNGEYDYISTAQGLIGDNSHYHLFKDLYKRLTTAIKETNNA